MDKSGALVWIAGLGAGSVLLLMVFVTIVFVVPSAIFGVVAWRSLDTFESHSARVERIAVRQMDLMERLPEETAEQAQRRADFDREFDAMGKNLDLLRSRDRADRASSRAAFDQRYRRVEQDIERGRLSMR